MTWMIWGTPMTKIAGTHFGGTFFQAQLPGPISQWPCGSAHGHLAHPGTWHHAEWGNETQLSLILGMMIHYDDLKN